MKKLVVAYLIGFTQGIWAARVAPQRIMTHFDIQGHADGWMAKSRFLNFQLLMLTLMFAVFIIMTKLISKLPDWMIDVPYKQHWLNAHERPRTIAWLTEMHTRLGVFVILYMTLLFALTTLINLKQPASLAWWQVVCILLISVFAVVWWIHTIRRRFINPDVLITQK